MALKVSKRGKNFLISNQPMLYDSKPFILVSKKYLVCIISFLGIIALLILGARLLGQSPFLVLTTLFLLVFIPLMGYSLMFSHRLAFMLLMIAFPFHSLVMRVIEVDLGIVGGVGTLISTWKEMVILILLSRLIFVSPKYFSSTDTLILSFVGFNFLYSIVPSDFAAGLYGFRGVIEPFLIYFLVRIVRFRHTDMQNLFRTLVIVGMLLGIFGVVQFIFLGSDFVMTYKAIAGELSNSHTTRVVGNFIFRSSATFTSPNHLGMYLAILLLVTLGVYVESNVKLKSIMIPLIFMGLGLFSSFSRSSWLAIVAGGAVVALLIILHRRVKRKLFIGSIISMVIAVPAVYYLGVFDYVVATLLLEEISAAGKIPSILEGLNFMVSNPLGIGLGLAGPRSTRFGELTVHSENFYIIMGMETGYLGILMYLLIIFSVIVKLMRIYYRLEDGFEKGLILGCLAALIGTHTGVLFIPSLQELSVSTLLWLFVGISFQYDYLSRQELKKHQFKMGLMPRKTVAPNV
ncbi:MAG: O-antigen ligase family protein [Chloroflexota bacterium]